MIGTLPTGAVPGVIISGVAHEAPLTVTVDGRPARLAIIDDDGHVIAAGDAVAREAKFVAINLFKEFLKGRGMYRVMSPPIPPIPPSQ